MMRIRNMSPTSSSVSMSPSRTPPASSPSTTPSTTTTTTTTTTTPTTTPTTSPTTTTRTTTTTTVPSSTPSRSTTTTPRSMPSRSTTPVAMPPLRADVSLEESALPPKIEPAIIFQDERGPASPAVINKSAARFLTIAPLRSPASQEVLLLPPLRSEHPITGINEVVFRAVAPTTTARPLSSAVEAFLTGENCKDMRYSCSYWIRSNPRVCQEQEIYMRLQCAQTCSFCKP
uniref:ShKT domain-containing protein n=1 Tax=Steinernema glaseri TaxID=37863 RepID=A0A1I7Z108_9BILA